MQRIILAFIFIALSLSLATARPGTPQKPEARPQTLSPDGANAAKPGDTASLDTLSPELTLKLQVLLDRAHFSPGEIDGHMGENTIKAFEAFERANGFVTVGTRISPRPPRRSRRALLTHRAPP